MNEELLQKIKTRGYWRINFRPHGNPMDLSLQKCRELVRDNSVKLRGWNYPFYYEGDADHYGISNYNDHLGAWIDAGEQKEVWNLYKSSQFIHFISLDEDWMDGSQERQFSNLRLNPGENLNFVGSLTYHLTEVFEFLGRLHKNGLYQNGVNIDISLVNTRGRKLMTFDSFRHLSYPRISSENLIEYNADLSGTDLNSQARDLALPAILHVFEIFNFGDVSVDQVIKKDQDNLYKSAF